MIVCTHCGKRNRHGAYYCKHCGRSVVCPRCRLILTEPASFCDNCGQSLVTAAAVASSAIDSGMAFSQPITEANTDEFAANFGLIQDSDAPAQKGVSGGPAYLDQFIPQELMVKLEAARSSSGMVNERRVVTMLFCDVKGSTAAAEKLDPEEWTEIINGGLEFMIRSVYKYEGTVARLMGDAILAFFGAPLAHEDDPRRAVLAGLDMVAALEPYRQKVKEQWDIDFNARVGINTGLVVVGTVGSDLRMEYTAMGDAINLAARMEQTARPGTIQITEHTYKLVSRFFEFEELGGIELKGKTESIPCYRVIRSKELSRRPGLTEDALPLVGRDEAIKQLTDAMEKVHLGSGQIVTIIGEVGLGKSRLVEELYREWAIRLAESALGTAENEQPISRWYNAFSLSYESSQPYGLFRHLLRQACGASIADPLAVLREKLHAFLSAIMPPDECENAQIVLETLFGLGKEDGTNLEGEIFKRQLYDTVSALVDTWSNDSPGVIVCDDLHWADPASVDLLVHLFKIIEHRPLLLICALRPNRTSPGWQIRNKADQEFPHRYTEITLEPLSKEESRYLISSSLNSEQLPESLVDTIQAKAAGNPYFVEEVVRALIDQGSLVLSADGENWRLNPEIEINQLAIPDTLQSTLIARIDRLSESQRRILQLAAVIGRSFYYRVLKEISVEIDTSGGSKNGAIDAHLGDLQRMDLINQTARIPELVYIFRQALVQESAYKTILRKQRKEYHQKVGEAIEKLFSDNFEEHAIILAYHFSEAGDSLKAMNYHTIAADSAYRLYANTEAVEHYNQALEFAASESPTTEQLIHLYTSRGRALEINADIESAAQNYETMREHAEQTGSQKLELASLVLMATLYSQPTSIFNMKLVESLSDQALVLSKELNDQAAESKILWNLSNILRYGSRLDEGLDLGEKALSIARELGLREQIAYSLNDLAHLYNRLGQYGKTKESLDEAGQLWREMNNLPMLADSLSTAAYVNTYTGDYDIALSASNEAWEISSSISNIWGLAYSKWAIGQVFWARGMPMDAIETMKECIHYAEEAEFVIAQVYTRSLLALAYAELGDIDQGLANGHRSVNLATDVIRPLRPVSLLYLATIQLVAGDLDAAEETSLEMRSEDAPLIVSQPDTISKVECEIPYMRGDFQKSISLCVERIDSLERIGLKSYLPEANLVLARAYISAGDVEQAQEVLVEGLHWARTMGARWYEWQLLSTLADQTSGDAGVEMRSKAHRIVEEICSAIEDSGLREHFLGKSEVAALFSSDTASHQPQT